MHIIWIYKRVEFGGYNLFQYFASNNIFCVLYGVCVLKRKENTYMHMTVQTVVCHFECELSEHLLSLFFSKFSLRSHPLFIRFIWTGSWNGVEGGGEGGIQTRRSWSTVSVAFNEYMAPFVNFLFGISCLLLTGYSGRLHATVASVW